MYMYILKECIHKDYLSLQKKGVIETNILQQISWKLEFFFMDMAMCIFSSPEPKAHRWAYRIPMVRRPSSVIRPSTILNVFSSETARPIKAKFYV